MITRVLVLLAGEDFLEMMERLAIFCASEVSKFTMLINRVVWLLPAVCRTLQTKWAGLFVSEKREHI